MNDYLLGYEELIELPFQNMFSESKTPITTTYWDQARDFLNDEIDLLLPPSGMLEKSTGFDEQNKALKDKVQSFLNAYTATSLKLKRAWNLRDTEFAQEMFSRTGNTNMVLLGLYRKIRDDIHPGMWNLYAYKQENPDFDITPFLAGAGTKVLRYAVIGLVAYGVILGVVPLLLRSIRKKK